MIGVNRKSISILIDKLYTRELHNSIQTYFEVKFKLFINDVFFISVPAFPSLHRSTLFIQYFFINSMISSSFPLS